MANGVLDTSITDTRARDFLRDAKDREKLQCTRIKGFHLIKVGAGGSWRYRYLDAAGKQRVQTVGNYPTMKPAQAATIAGDWRNNRVDPLAERKVQRAIAQTVEQVAESRKLETYLDNGFTLHQSRERDGGVETIKLIRRSFPALLSRDMATINEVDIKTWQLGREQAGRTHETIKRAFMPLKRLFKLAVKGKVLEHNPLADVRLTPARADEKMMALDDPEAQAKRRMLTTKELAGIQKGLALLTEDARQKRRNSRAHGKPHLPDLDDVTFPHWFVPFCLCAMHLGMRPGDLYALNWTDLNLTFKRLVKYPEKTKHHEKPAKLDLPLSDEVISVLTEWHKQQGKPDSGLVFPSPVTDEKMDKKTHDRPWTTVLTLGKLPDDLDFYSLRHHFISSLVAAGTPLLAVARLAGHKSTKMIELHYGHLSPSVAADLMQNFSATINPKKQNGKPTASAKSAGKVLRTTKPA